MGQAHRVRIGDFEVGNDLPLTFIAGPCQMESRQHAIDMSGALKEIFGRLGANFVYKTSYDKANRSSGKTPRGMGLEAAAPVFNEVRETMGCPVITDVHLPEDCAPVAEFVDVLQIPAFLCRQTDLLEAAGRTGKPVHVKKGQFLAPQDMKNVVGKLEDVGNESILLCERGVTFGYNNLVSDMRSLP
ncbi:MAG: 3-deoxy-8-phosphooctulonate synthase, partial [Gammaproteobacteria bacterium]